MKKELQSSLFILAVGFFFFIYSWQYELGSLKNPGEALFPLVFSLVVMAIGLGIFMKNYFTLRKNASRPLSAKSIAKHAASSSQEENNISVGRVAFLTVVIAVVIALIKYIGFYPASFLLVIACCRILGVKNWPVIVLIAFFSVLAIYLIFDFWLHINFPVGIFLG